MTFLGTFREKFYEYENFLFFLIWSPYLKSYLVGLFGSLFYELKKPLETNKLFSLQKVKLKLFSLERDKNKKVFRTKTQKGPRGNFLDIRKHIFLGPFKKSTPKFHTDPLSSTHQFHTRTTPFQAQKSPSFTSKTPQFNTPTPSVQHIPHTKNPSVPHRKPLSSTPKCVELRGVWN